MGVVGRRNEVWSKANDMVVIVCVQAFVVCLSCM